MSALRATSLRLTPLAAALLLAACSTVSTPPAPVSERPVTPSTPTASTPATSTSTSSAPTGTPNTLRCTYQPPASGGGFYQDDGPHANTPQALDAIPNPLPRWEPLHRFANRPYTVLGQSFTPLTQLGQYQREGVGSWYGRKFHGQKTSSGEIYDMYAMTAASPVLPIPSYARVTNLDNGNSVIVRINDRGPFLRGRIIDLSFLAACRLGYVAQGHGRVKVESLVPPDAPASAQQPLASTQLPAPQVTPATAVAQEARGFFLQLGAFGNAEKAGQFRKQLGDRLGAAHASRLVIHQGQDGLNRVRLGPFADKASALAVAEQLERQHQLPIVINNLP